MDATVLSIIIVNWRVPDLLRGCLNSVVEYGGLDGAAMDIVVVDNASGDTSAAMVRSEFPGVLCIESPTNLGFGRANVLGLQHCRAPLVLLLNPDTLMPQGGLVALCEKMASRPDVAALGCRLVNGDGTLQRWTGGQFPTLWNSACHYLFLDKVLGPFGPSIYLKDDVRKDREVDWVSGACLMLRRAQIPDPLFDPVYFMYGEDMDLCHRIKQSGHQVLYSPVVSVTHFQGASMRKQSGDVLLTSLKGIRSFYANKASALHVLAFDAVTIMGFGLRWAAFAAAAWFRPEARWHEKASSSRQHAGLAWTLMRRGTS